MQSKPSCSKSTLSLQKATCSVNTCNFISQALIRQMVFIVVFKLLFYIAWHFLPVNRWDFFVNTTNFLGNISDHCLNSARPAQPDLSSLNMHHLWNSDVLAPVHSIFLHKTLIHVVYVYKYKYICICLHSSRKRVTKQAYLLMVHILILI